MRRLTGLFFILLSSLAAGHAVALDTAPSGKVFGVKVAAGKLVSTLDGSPVQLRGANYSSLESPAAGPPAPFNPTSRAATAPASEIQHYSNATLGSYPWWAVPKSWKMNAFRIPLNEASWLRN